MSKALMTPANVQQYLSFLLDGQEYGVNILLVQEIRGWENVKPIPKSPDFVAGIINLRGHIIPIIDMRLRFGLAKREYTKTTVVVYVRVPYHDDFQVLGLIVDSVSDVYDVQQDDHKPCPEVLGSIETQYLESLVVAGDKMIAVIDLQQSFNMNQLLALSSNVTSEPVE